MDVYPVDHSIVGVVYRKRMPSKEPGTHNDYTDMKYSAKTNSLRYQSGPHSKLTLPSHQRYMKSPEAAVNPFQDIELKENKELAEGTYENV